MIKVEEFSYSIPIQRLTHIIYISPQYQISNITIFSPKVISVSSDVFQERLDEVIKMLPGVTGIADDVLAKGHSEINHDIAVLSLPEAAQNNYLKYNPDKIQFNTRKYRFLGSFSPHMA